MPSLALSIARATKMDEQHRLAAPAVKRAGNLPGCARPGPHLSNPEEVT